MSKPVFFIPIRRIYWGEAPTDDPVDPMRSDRWTTVEAGRAKTSAEKLFPAIEFMLVEDPPCSQTYEAGSTNQEIRTFLEARTTLRFEPKRNN